MLATKQEKVILITHTQVTTTSSYQQLGFDEIGAIEALPEDSRELRRGTVDHMDSNYRIHSLYFADTAQAPHLSIIAQTKTVRNDRIRAAFSNC